MNKILNEFKQFCVDNGTDERLEEIDWYDMSIGFFVAKGLNFNEAEKLALKARYDYHYWQYNGG